MYKVYFENRLITICTKKELVENGQGQVLFCKNKKSFDKAYHLFLNDLAIVDLTVICDKPKKLFNYLKNKYSIVKAAGGIVINEKNEVLLIKRRGFWDLPKGKIEKGEGKKNAAIREVEEECGISGLEIVKKTGKTYHTYQFSDKNVFKITYWYIMKYAGSETLIPQTEEDITEVKWITKTEIKSILNKTYDSLRPLFIEVADS